MTKHSFPENHSTHSRKHAVEKTLFLGVCTSLGLAVTFLPAYGDGFLSSIADGTLTGWTKYGSVVATTTTDTLQLGPEGNQKPFSLTPASGEAMAIISPTDNAVSGANIDAVLGLTSGTTNTVLSTVSGGNQSTNFAVATKTVTLSAGTYTYYWSYAAQDYHPYNDGVFFSLSGNGVNTLDILASNGPDGAQPTTNVVGDYGATQWAATSFTIVAPGTYQISFGNYNWIDQSVNPILFVGASAGTLVTPTSSSPINTNAAYYNASDLGTTVTADFKGGTLRIDAGGIIASSFTIEAYSGNIIDAYGHTGVFSGAMSGPGGLTFADSVGGGTLVLTGNNTYTGGTTIASGTLQIGAGGTSGAIVGNIVDNGALVFDLSTATAYGSTISGTGTVTVAGTGTVILNGQNTYSGATTVVGATLIVGDAAHPSAGVLGSVTAASGGTIGGYGTIGGNLTASGGTVSPGNSIGTLTVSGNYAQSAASTLAIEVSPTTNDKLVVDGTATLAGSLNVTLASGTYSGNTYSLIQANAVSGRFATVHYAGTTNDMVYGIYYAPDGKGVDLAVQSKNAGEVYGDVVTAGLETALTLNRATLSHVGAVDRPGLSLWGQPVGGVSYTDGTQTTHTFNTQLLGAVGGVDYRLEGGSAITAAFGYAHNQLGVSGQRTKAGSNGYYASLAAHIPLDALDFDLSGFFMKNNVGVTRSLGTGGIAAGAADNTIGGGSLQFGYRIGDFLPFARLTVASLWSDAFAETKAGALGLSAGNDTRTAIRGTWGVEYTPVFTAEDGIVLAPRFTAGVENEFGDNDRNFAMALAGTDFLAPATAPGKVSGLAAASLRVQLKDGLAFDIDASGRASGNQREGLVSLGVQYTF